jgi:predicted DNA-binding transcriptional regulator YafY
LASLRGAIRAERKVWIGYIDGSARVTERMISPFALAFFDQARVVVAWCELRAGYRHFRVDRIGALTATETRYPRSRRVLLKEWRLLEGIPEPSAA